MRIGVYVTVGRPSVCLSCRSTAATAAGWYAAECFAGRRYRSGALRVAEAANPGSVMLRKRFNTDLVLFALSLQLFMPSGLRRCWLGVTRQKEHPAI